MTTLSVISTRFVFRSLAVLVACAVAALFLVLNVMHGGIRLGRKVYLVDMSGSGRFGTTGGIKRETMAEIAAILAFNAIRNNDKAGAILFTDRVERYIPPKKGSAHVWRLIHEIFTFQPERTGTGCPRDPRRTLPVRSGRRRHR